MPVLRESLSLRILSLDSNRVSVGIFGAEQMQKGMKPIAGSSILCGSTQPQESLYGWEPKLRSSRDWGFPGKETLDGEIEKMQSTIEELEKEPCPGCGETKVTIESDWVWCAGCGTGIGEYVLIPGAKI